MTLPKKEVWESVLRRNTQGFLDKPRESSEWFQGGIQDVCEQGDNMMWKDGELFTHVPMPIVETRPLIIYHPAADLNYINSWSIMVENSQPFVLFCDEMGPRYPDDLPFIEDSLRFEYFSRIANPLIGGRAYRNSELGYQNMLVQRQKDAKEGILELPQVDILYLDWLDPFSSEVGQESFSDIIPKLAKSVRDGGLIILDRKHVDAVPLWFEYPNLLLSTSDGVCVEHIGRGEWPIPFVDLPNTREVTAEIFKVSNKSKQEGLDEFLASLMMERRLRPEELEKIKYKLPPRWPGHPDLDSWIERYMDYLDFPEMGEPYLPCPPKSSWKTNEYSTWVQSLIDNPEQLRPIPRIEKTLNLGIDVILVNGDITEHLDWLLWKEASLITRSSLMSDCLSKCCWLQHKAVNLQPMWEKPLIPNLIWSGQDSTSNLTVKLLNLAKSPVVATIVYGLASIEQLENELLNYKGNVKELIIFHLDKDDFQ